jgi:hypothetical protein
MTSTADVYLSEDVSLFFSDKLLKRILKGRLPAIEKQHGIAIGNLSLIFRDGLCKLGFTVQKTTAGAEVQVTAKISVKGFSLEKEHTELVCRDAQAAFDISGVNIAGKLFQPLAANKVRSQLEEIVPPKNISTEGKNDIEISPFNFKVRLSKFKRLKEILDFEIPFINQPVRSCVQVGPCTFEEGQARLNLKVAGRIPSGKNNKEEADA